MTDAVGVDADALEREVRRVADRLRTMPLPRLEARAAEVRPVLQRLADAAALLTGEPARPVPDAGVPALGDQAAVLGRELTDAVRSDPAAAAPAAPALAALQDLRRAL